MKVKPSNHDISVLTSHLIAALNDVTVCRYAHEKGSRVKVPVKRVKVPLTIGHKTRQMAEAIQVNGQIRVPVIAITMTGFSLDSKRNTAKHIDFVDPRWDGTDGFINTKKPTPVNINYNVSIMTDTGSDLEEILLHYLSVFNPSIQISWMNPLVPEELISKITWDGSATPNFPTETNSDQKIRYQVDMGFTLEGWVFGEKPKNLEGIKKIVFNVGLLEGVECGEVLGNIYPDATFVESRGSEIHTVEPDCVEVGKYINVYGKNLNNIEGIYFLPLSGSVLPTSSFEPFCFSQSLSGQCPEFEGYPLEYTVLDYDTISIQIPDDIKGEMDVLITNRVNGCNKLSDSKFCGTKVVTVSNPELV